MPLRPLALLAVAVLALGAAGCGAGATKTVTAPGTTATSPRTGLTAAQTAQLQIVRNWANLLRAGRADRAARTFSLPAQVANGGPKFALTTRPEVVFFNQTLPCGAKVVGAVPAAHGFLRVSFLLTERTGGEGACGSGAGQTAQTLVRVVDGHITDWLRAPDPVDGPTTDV
jgi:hypothetical protein